MAAGIGLRTLRVQLCPLGELAADSVLGYQVLDAQRRVLERGAKVPAALPRLLRTELVLAAPDVLLIDAALPRLSGSRLRAALAGIAEPVLLTDIEQCFAVAGRPDGAGRATIAVLDRTLLARALALFAQIGIVPASATPEPLAMPVGPRKWRLRQGESYAALRMGERLGIACSADVDGGPPVELRLALDGSSAKPEAIEIEGEFDAPRWEEALGIKLIPLRAETDRAAPVSLELLQYEFAPRIADWRAWRVPAALAAALALVWAIALGAQTWWMAVEESRLRADMEAVFRKAFPKVTSVLDPLLQMRRGVAELRSGAGTPDATDFTPLATSFARAAQLEADAVRSIEYANATLRVRFEARALDTPQKRNALVERLAKAGLTAQVSDAGITVKRAGRL